MGLGIFAPGLRGSEILLRLLTRLLEMQRSEPTQNVFVGLLGFRLGFLLIGKTFLRQTLQAAHPKAGASVGPVPAATRIPLTSARLPGEFAPGSSARSRSFDGRADR